MFHNIIYLCLKYKEKWQSAHTPKVNYTILNNFRYQQKSPLINKLSTEYTLKSRVLNGETIGVHEIDPDENSGSDHFRFIALTLMVQYS